MAKYYNDNTAYDRAEEHELEDMTLPPSIRRQKEFFGYTIYLVRRPKREGGYAVMSGCRFFTPDAARDHWMERRGWQSSSPDTEVGKRVTAAVAGRAFNMVALLPKLKRRARSYGWL